jgi:hypothetical protein
LNIVAKKLKERMSLHIHVKIKIAGWGLVTSRITLPREPDHGAIANPWRDGNFQRFDLCVRTLQLDRPLLPMSRISLH